MISLTTHTIILSILTGLSFSLSAMEKITSLMPTFLSRKTVTVPAFIEKHSIHSQQKGWFLEDHTKNPLQSAILEPKLAAFIEQFTTMLKKNLKDSSPLQNMLFFGPAANGKTFIAQRLGLLAHNLGFDYIYFSVHTLERYPLVATPLKQVIAFAKKHAKKVMIIIDEIDVLEKYNCFDCLHDSEGKSATAHSKQNYFIVGLTGNPQGLDQLLDVRPTEMLFFGPPSEKQAREMLENEIKKAFTVGHQNHSCPIQSLVIEEGALSEAVINEVLKTILHHNFSFHEIGILVRDMQIEAFASHVPTVTQSLVRKVLDEAIAKKNECPKAPDQ